MNRNRIIEQLKIDEGFDPISRWDNGHWTYGHGCTAPGPGVIISRQAAAELLERRVNVAIHEFHEIFADQPMSDTRQGALVNMLFNLGQNRFLKFRKMIAAIKEDDWEQAGNEAADSLWYRQTGDRAKRIVSELKGE